MEISPSQDDQGPLPVPMTKPESDPVAVVPSAPVAEADLRASDADRELVADLLRDAYAEGRLTIEEHSERMEAVYAARTFGELAPLTRDLPAGAGPRPVPPSMRKAEPRPERPPLPPARDESPMAVAVFGGVERKGRWRVGSRLRAVAVFGGVELDLTDAVFESPEVVIEVTAVFGGVDIKVPENVSLHGSGVGVFGGFSVSEQASPDPYAPVVRVKGAAVFGGCEAKPRRGKKLREWVRKQLDGD